MTNTTTAGGAGAPAPAEAPPAPSAAGDSGDRNGRGPGESAPEPEFTELEDWLTEYFLPMFRRTLGGEYRWCRQWWRHGEAISRLNSLWHAWEVLRTLPGTGIGIWYREHLDHQLPLLLGARGPFYQCSEDAHREPHEAAADPAPDGWWDRAAGPGDAADHARSTRGDGNNDDDAVTGDDDT